MQITIEIDRLTEVLQQVVPLSFEIDKPLTGEDLVAHLRAQGVTQTALNPLTHSGWGVTRKGATAALDLVSALRRSEPALAWGCDFEVLREEVMRSAFAHAGLAIDAALATAVSSQLEVWFQTVAVARHHYVPCSIVPEARANWSFDIGPIKFLPLSQFMDAKRKPVDELTYGALEKMGSERHGSWLAQVTVPRCEPVRSALVADLSVDLALTGLQLTVSPEHGRFMGRVSGRMPPAWRGSVSVADGQVSSGVETLLPGLGIFEAALRALVVAQKGFLDSVGRRVSGYLSRSAVCGSLSQAWCDGVYWYREALAEPLDTIAAAKYETAIEVLMRAEKTSQSGTRMHKAFKAFFGLESQDTISSNSANTVKEFVKSIVGVRSRVMHGTFSTLVDDARIGRGEAEAFARTVLRHFSVRLDEYEISAEPEDETDAFLHWVQANRQKPKIVGSK